MEPVDQRLNREAADVVLRPYRGGAIDAIDALTQDAVVGEFLPDGNVPKAQSQEWLVHFAMSEDVPGFLAAVAAGGRISATCA